MFTNKKTAATLISCLVASAISFPSAAATVFKLSHNQDRSHPVHKSMKFMADEVKELTNGEVKIVSTLMVSLVLSVNQWS